MKTANRWELENVAKKLSVTAQLSEDIGIGILGEQQIGCDYTSGKALYDLLDRYAITLDLSDVNGERLDGITVKLPGLEVELGFGWFAVKTDYDWKTYIEYDSPKKWKKTVLEGEQE
ncbi:MAG: hypothetical protein IJ113_06475 [Eggerthellaceae bacterium]|nr:hypothetical protein [Eggerthellaceae bacterium]